MTWALRQGLSERKKPRQQSKAKDNQPINTRLTPLPKDFIRIEPFGFNVSVSKGRKAFLRCCSRYYGIDMSKSAFGEGYSATFENQSGQLAFAMMVPEHYCEETVYHEALHIAWFVLDEAGVKVTADNHEMLAYMQGSIAHMVKAKLWPELLS